MFKKRHMLFLLGFACSTLLCGCGNPVSWNVVLASKNGNTVLDMTGVTIIFLEERYNGGFGSTATVWEPIIFNPLTAIRGVSTSGGTGADKFDSVFAHHIQTMTFRGHTIQIKEAGRKLEIDGQSFALQGKKKTFLVPKKGKITFRDFTPDDPASPFDIITPAMKGAVR